MASELEYLPSDEARGAYEPPSALRLGGLHAGAGNTYCSALGSGNQSGCADGNSAAGAGCLDNGNDALFGDCVESGITASGGGCDETGYSPAYVTCAGPGSSDAG